MHFPFRLNKNVANIRIFFLKGELLGLWSTATFLAPLCNLRPDYGVKILLLGPNCNHKGIVVLVFLTVEAPMEQSFRSYVLQAFFRTEIERCPDNKSSYLCPFLGFLA